MSAPVRRRAHLGRCYGSLSIALGLSALARCRPEYLVFPLLTSVAPWTPPDVGVPRLVLKDVPRCGEWVSTLLGYENAQIQSQMRGYLIEENCKERLVRVYAQRQQSSARCLINATWSWLRTSKTPGTWQRSHRKTALRRATGKH